MDLVYPAASVQPGVFRGSLFMALITLRVLDGSDRGKVFDALPTPVTIGREEGNTVQLNDERISRFHLKIQEDQDKLVLTDLDSTNGTKVNGEDVQLRILRMGDLVTVGRTVLLLGSRDDIAERLASLRNASPERLGTISYAEALEAAEAGGFDFELQLGQGSGEMPVTGGVHEPPPLPARLSPGQAAQLCEVFEYFHHRVRSLLASAKADEKTRQFTLDERKWQALVDIQARLAEYLRAIAEPGSE